MSDLLSGTHDMIDRAGQGDEAARRLPLERFRDYLKSMVAVRLDRRLAMRLDPSDVVQETLVEASKRLEDYLRDRPQPFYGWLRGLAGERIIDTHRRHVTAQRRSEFETVTARAGIDVDAFGDLADHRLPVRADVVEAGPATARLR